MLKNTYNTINYIIDNHISLVLINDIKVVSNKPSPIVINELQQLAEYC